MKHLVTLPALGFLLASIACGGGGGGGGPTEPLPNPTISSVNPSQAQPGDQITITGSNLGGAQSSVTFNGVAGAVGTASATSIVATVPNIAVGPATITVTASGRTGSYSGFTVIAPTPVVSSVSPNPVRAGGTLIISGQNLRASQGLALSQTVTVLIDGVAVTPLSTTNTEIQVLVPINVTPGNHVLRVQVDAGFSNSVPFEVEIFTVTGTYVAQGPVIINSCLGFGIGNPVGTEQLFEIAMTDSRPTVSGRIGAGAVQGTLTSAGSFNMSRTVTEPGAGSVTSRVEGALLAVPDGTVGFSGRYSLSASGAFICSIVVDLIGVRVSLVATSRAPASAVFGGEDVDGMIREALDSALVITHLRSD